MTHYDTLGVSRRASVDEIRSAFRAAAKERHPDRFPSYLQKVHATRRMQDLNAAYAVLRDPEARRTYDATLNPEALGDSLERVVAKPGDPDDARGPGLTRQAAHPSSSRQPDRATVWMVILWLLMAIGYGASLWAFDPPATIAGALLLVVTAVFVSPLLLMAVGAVLVIPVAIVLGSFVQGMERQQRAMPVSKLRVTKDLLLRLVALALVLAAGVALWYARITADILYVGVLASASAFVGEIVAMVVYMFRRPVLRATETLLQMDLVPMGAHSNGA